MEWNGLTLVGTHSIFISIVYEIIQNKRELAIPIFSLSSCTLTKYSQDEVKLLFYIFLSPYHPDIQISDHITLDPKYKKKVQ